MTISTTINLDTEIADKALMKIYTAYQNITTARHNIRNQIHSGSGLEIKQGELAPMIFSIIGWGRLHQ